MTELPFGRAVRLISERSKHRSALRVGLESVQQGTGRLIPTVEAEYEGDGVSFRRGDVLFGKLRPNLRKAWLADTDGDAVGDFHVYRPVANLMTGRYLLYLVLSEPFLSPVIASVSGAKMPRADWMSVRDISVWVPTIGVQRAIADYLDRETAQIDAFIAKNEELIALLTERRSTAARCGVEHHVGSGSRLKFGFYEVDKRAGDKAYELPLLSVSIHHGVAPHEIGDGDAEVASGLLHYKVAEPGDIVVNRMRAFQGGLGVSLQSGLVSPDYSVLRVKEGIDAEWLSLVMKTPRFVGEMTRRLRGIGSTDSGAVRTPRIAVADLGSILVDVPSREQQLDELRTAQNEVGEIDAALAVAKRCIDLARERRAALISAAVTGQIDLGVAA